MTDLHNVLMQQPSGLVFDIDGTLSPIAPTPDEARLYPGVAALLEKATEYAHVAIMTGRSVENGAAMINVEGLTYIGSHGAEWSEGLPSTHQIQVASETAPFIEPARHLLNLAEQKLAHIPGILIERKRIGGAVHYRLTADHEQTRQIILDTLREPAETHHLLLSEGKKVVEIKPAVAINKGLALRRLVQQFGLKGVIFAGDDRTDLDAILEISRLKQEGIAAASIAVQHTDTLPDLLEKADVIVQEVDGMVQLLRDLVESLHN
jgi:trehalose 6-phosphate phosphatase